MKNLKFVLILALSISFLQSCTKDDNLDPMGQVAPELPPQESFVMDFSDFDDDDTTGLDSGNTNGSANATYRNWFYSAGNIVVWNTVIVLYTAIPTLSFYESFKHSPQFQGDATWLWAYDFTAADGAVYQAELYGKVLPSAEVQWDMYISKQGGFSQVHWYSGITANDRSYANWTLNYNPNNPKPFIKIDFQRDATNNLESIRYTNIIPNVADNGDYIEYREINDPAADLDRTYEVYKINANNLLQINWNEANHNGQVKDEAHFQDTEWHCWGIDYADKDC